MSIEDAYREARKKISGYGEQRLKRYRAARTAREQGEDQSEIGRTKRQITYVLSRVGVLNIEGCLAWAFGPMWDQIPINDWWIVWNKFHGKLFLIGPLDKLEDAFARIGRSYIAFTLKYLKGNQFPVIGRDEPDVFEDH